MVQVTGEQQAPRRRRARTIAIAAVAAVAIAAAVVWAGSLWFSDRATGPNPGDIDTARDVQSLDLAEGNCVESLEYVSDWTLRQIPCDLPHLAQVVGELPIEDAQYEGSSHYEQVADEYCLPRAYDVIPAEMDADPLTTRTIYPAHGAWESGHTTILCLVTVANGYHFTGSFIAGNARLHDGAL